MAELVVTQDEQALRRRARRRLVGTVAIALTSFVVLPMLFDGEPKPLGPDVDIRIPAQNTPFEPAPAVVSPIPSEDSAAGVQTAEPTQPVAPVESPVATPAATPAAPPVDAPKKEAKPPVAAVVAEKTVVKPPPKPELKPDKTFSTQGYFLQLGAFGNESNARQLHEKAVTAGFNVVLVSTNNQFRVRVGPIPKHEKALEIQARLKAKGFSPVLLGP